MLFKQQLLTAISSRPESLHLNARKLSLSVRLKYHFKWVRKTQKPHPIQSAQNLKRLWREKRRRISKRHFPEAKNHPYFYFFIYGLLKINRYISILNFRSTERLFPPWEVYYSSKKTMYQADWDLTFGKLNY